MYELQPSDQAFVVQQLWARDDVSCGTSIPLIAEGQGVQDNATAFCVGALLFGGGAWVGRLDVSCVSLSASTAP